MKKVVLDSVGIHSDGFVSIKLNKTFIDDDNGEVVFSQPHRTIIGGYNVIEAQMESVFQHLDELGYTVPVIDGAVIIQSIKQAVVAYYDARGEEPPTIEPEPIEEEPVEEGEEE